jgi:hypothetical protein
MQQELLAVDEMLAQGVHIVIRGYQIYPVLRGLNEMPNAHDGMLGTDKAKYVARSLILASDKVVTVMKRI